MNATLSKLSCSGTRGSDASSKMAKFSSINTLDVDAASETDDVLASSAFSDLAALQHRMEDIAKAVVTVVRKAEEQVTTLREQAGLLSTARKALSTSTSKENNSVQFAVRDPKVTSLWPITPDADEDSAVQELLVRLRSDIQARLAKAAHELEKCVDEQATVLASSGGLLEKCVDEQATVLA